MTVDYLRIVRIIPITNSNGVVVTGADTTDSSWNRNSESLRAPNPESGSESGFYNSGE